MLAGCVCESDGGDKPSVWLNLGVFDIPSAWRSCPADVLVVFNTALFLISPRLFGAGGITSRLLWDI